MAKTTTPTPRAVFYLRTASAAQEDSEAIDRQRRACLAMAKRLKTDIVHEFVDQGQSGATLDRPGLNFLRSYLNTNDVSYVIAADVARLGRSHTLTCQLILQLQELGATVALADPDVLTEVHLGDENGQIHPTGATSA